MSRPEAPHRGKAPSLYNNNNYDDDGDDDGGGDDDDADVDDK